MSVMPAAMKSWGTHLTREGVKNLNMDVVTGGLADTGAQTNSAGVSLLRKLGFPEEKMMKTNHNIIGAATPTWM